MSRTLTVLGVDPGFASTGWALVDLMPDGKTALTKLGVIRTEKAGKKQNVLVANDNFKRAREISRAIAAILSANHVDCICAESMSFPRNASTAGKMALCWGVIADICEQMHLPVLMATPKEIKQAVGSDGSSKEAVQVALRSRFGSKPKELLDEAGIPGGQREHPYDALASVVACLDSETLRLMWRAAS